MTEMELRQHFVDTARRYYGAVEGGTDHAALLAAYNNHNPLPRGYTMKPTDAWCAAFVSAISILCGLTEIIPAECSCNVMLEQHKALGSWYEADDLDPQPGDLLIYDWDDNGVGDCTNSPDHIGIVVRVTKGIIRVIEGNMNNKVWHRDIEVNGRYIRGYCRPNFAKLAEKEPATLPSFTDVPANTWYAEAVAKVVDAGLMVGKGNGIFDPDAPVTRAELATVLARML